MDFSIKNGGWTSPYEELSRLKELTTVKKPEI
jgi:hypothetical protein